MKKLSILSAIVLLLGAGSAFAQPNYQFAEAGTKNFITETTILVNDQISLDIYLADVGAPQSAGGVWIDFSGSTGDVALVSAGRAFQDGSEGVVGPWTNGAGANVSMPAGPGTHMLGVANLGGAAPDGDGDLIIGTVTLQNTGTNDATVNFTTIPSVATWSPIDDTDVISGSLLIHQIQTVLPCPSETIYSTDSAETQLLRSLRDNVLSQTHEGKELIKLYYQWSPAIVRAMEHDEEFKEDIKAMVDRVLGMIEVE
jgi:hypothetical protein